MVQALQIAASSTFWTPSGDYVRPAFPIVSSSLRREHFRAAGSLVAIYILASEGSLPFPISPLFLLAAMSSGALSLLTKQDLSKLDDSMARQLTPWFDHQVGEPLRPGTQLLGLINDILPGDGVNVGFHILTG
jgi:hypothetical protein